MPLASADLIDIPTDLEGLDNDELFRVARHAGVVLTEGNTRVSLLQALRRAAL